MMGKGGDVGRKFECVENPPHPTLRWLLGKQMCLPLHQASHAFSLGHEGGSADWNWYKQTEIKAETLLNDGNEASLNFYSLSLPGCGYWVWRCAGFKSSRNTQFVFWMIMFVTVVFNPLNKTTSKTILHRKENYPPSSSKNFNRQFHNWHGIGLNTRVLKTLYILFICKLLPYSHSSGTVLFFYLHRPPRWHSGKASASRAEGPGFESHLHRDFFGVESYQWLKNWHSSGYPARCLEL